MNDGKSEDLLKKSDVRIFVVDDDPSISKAIAEVIKNLGYQAIVFAKPDDVANQYRLQGCQMFIIDCLLPKIPGVDLALTLREQGATDVPIIFISGIYRDKGFMKDAMRKANAKAYLTKPFDIKDLEDHITQELAPIVDMELSPLENLLVNYLSPGDRIKSLNHLGNIEALDLPWVICQLMLPAVSGTLTLKNDKQNVTINFSQGEVIQIEMKNDRSFFGQLLVENGFLTHEQLEQALGSNSQKKLGEKLVDLNFLSPHIIDVINAEQSAIRLSLLIASQVNYQISFYPKEFIHTSVTLNTEKLSPYLADWIHSKFTASWLQTRYLKWLDFSTQVTGKPNYFNRMWTLPPLQHNQELIKELTSGNSLNEVLLKGKWPEEMVYQVFHILIMTEFIKIQKETHQLSENTQVGRLISLWNNMQSQDHFSVLGVSRKAKAPEIKKTYYDLAKIFHPDKLSPKSTKQLREMTDKVFGQITRAYETLSEDDKKSTYLKEIELGQAETALQAETFFEEGKSMLKAGQHQRAREIFDKAALLRPPSSELLIHLCWARLASYDSGKESASLIGDVEALLNKIPPEDRHNAVYYFVKGMQLKLTGDFAASKKNLQHALFLSPKFTEAQRLLRFLDINAQAQKPTSILTADLKDVVGSFFKKK